MFPRGLTSCVYFATVPRYCEVIASLSDELSSYRYMTFPACGAVRVPQGRIVGGNETYEGEVSIRH